MKYTNLRNGIASLALSALIAACGPTVQQVQPTTVEPVKRSWLDLANDCSIPRDQARKMALQKLGYEREGIQENGQAVVCEAMDCHYADWEITGEMLYSDGLSSWGEYHGKSSFNVGGIVPQRAIVGQVMCLEVPGKELMIHQERPNSYDSKKSNCRSTYTSDLSLCESTRSDQETPCIISFHTAEREIGQAYVNIASKCKGDEICAIKEDRKISSDMAAANTQYEKCMEGPAESYNICKKAVENDLERCLE